MSKTILIDEMIDKLNLESLFPTKRKKIRMSVPDINRPGMQLCGYYEYFANERVQMIGKVEMAYLESLSSEARYQTLRTYMNYDIPCIMIAWNMNPPMEMLELAEKRDIPLFRSKQKTTKLTVQVISYLSEVLAPHMTCHADLIDVYGIGVLISGDSGVGKSEAAIELIKRGHQLCADDTVDIRRCADDNLIGISPEAVRHLMEIRGIGIVDIREMYGISAVITEEKIDMVIHLERWDSQKDYERLGQKMETTEILGVAVPYQVMPVKPGRNLAIVIEVAVRNLILNRMGISAAAKLEQRLKEQIQNNSRYSDDDDMDE